MKKLAAILLLMVFCLSLVSCGKTPTETAGNEGDFKIVTSFYPVYVVTLNLVDGAAGVTLKNLTASDYGCMHDYVMTTDELKKLMGVDLFIVSGMGMEAFVGKSLLGIPRLVVLDSGEDISSIESKNGKENPHYWMNIENAISQCDKIKRTLVRLNPENAEIYEKNAEEYKEKLSNLLAEMQKRAEGLSDKEIVVLDDSLDYFFEEFGIKTIKPQTSGSAHTLSEQAASDVLTYIVDNKTKIVYVDRGDAETSARRLIKNTDCSVAALDLVNVGVLSAGAKDAYINAIRYNFDVLEENQD